MTSSDKEWVALLCAIKNYKWGKLGVEGKACEFYAHNHPGFVADTTTPYAEIWLGTHPNGPSVLKDTGELLEEWISNHPETLGDAAVKKFGNKLPFLLKILSVRKPLSIQAHPGKALAKRLHDEKPEIYKDDNHKPEVLIALSDFTAMCGFRPKEQIIKYIRDVPEINPLLPEDSLESLMTDDENLYKQGLMKTFSQIITSPKDLVQQQVSKLRTRLGQSCSCDPLEELVSGLINEHPEDAGVFSPYLLNVLYLKEGEAIYLPVNEPHCYISGDGVECQAASDNVVRAGLTDKLVDKDTLLNMLTYESRTVDEIKVAGVRETEFSVLFSPPVEDFAVAVVDIPPKSVEVKLPCRQSPSLVMVVEGCAKGSSSLCLKKGESFLLPADFEVSVSQSEDSPRFLMFQAFVNI